MDFELTAEQQAIRETARRFALKEILPRAAEIDRSSTFDRDLYRGMGEVGLIGVAMPEEFGGSGADTITWCVVVEEVTKASSGMGNALGLTQSIADYILMLGTDEQKRTLLPSLARGDTMCSFALTEPDAGSDAASISTTARLEGDQYVLNGQKMFITAARMADSFVVVATLDKALGHKSIRTFLVPKDAEGLSLGEKLDLLGARGMETAPVYFDNCRVPRGNILGADVDGFKAVMRGLDGAGRLGAATMAVATAQAAFEAALEYAKQRVQFGKPIIEFQAVRFMLADMSIDINAARLLLYQAAWRRDRGQPFTKESSQAKVFASDMCMKHVANAMQIFGGYSYVKDFPVERYFRDSKIHQIWDGTNEIQRIIISRHLIKGT